MAFIVFEGLDGAGKSTLIEKLKTELHKKTQTFVHTREPGGTPLAEEIRKLLLRTDAEAPVPRAELLLYEASRAQHVDGLIKPALHRGDWVICDRYYASTVAFQAGGRKLNEKEIHWLNDFAVNDCHPDLWVLLDLTTEEAARRMQGRELDRFERENRDFHERVRSKYLELAQKNKETWLVLDASQSAEKLADNLFSRLRAMELL